MAKRNTSELFGANSNKLSIALRAAGTLFCNIKIRTRASSTATLLFPASLPASIRYLLAPNSSPLCCAASAALIRLSTGSSACIAFLLKSFSALE